MNFLKIEVQAACHSILNCQIDCISFYCYMYCQREPEKNQKHRKFSSMLTVVVYRTL